MTLTSSSSNTSLIPIPPITGNTLTYTPVVDASGSAVITITANDGQSANSTSTESFTVTVNAVNDPPTLATLANQTIDEDVGEQAVSLSFGPGGGSSEVGQSVTITASSSNPDLIPTPTAFNGTLKYTPAADAHGSATISVTADDGQSINDKTTQSFSVTVNAVNDAPVLTIAGELTIAEGDTLTLTLAATDVDGDSLTYSPSQLPDGASLTDSIFVWIPGFEQGGDYSITFTADDGQGGSDAQSMSITIVEALPPQIVPSLPAWQLGEVSLESAAERIFYVTNPGNDVVSIDELRLDAGADSPFSIISPSVPTVISESDSVEIRIRFNPIERLLADVADTLVIISDVDELRIPLSGLGLWGELLIEPDTLNFGEVPLENLQTEEVVIRNTGNDTLAVGTLEGVEEPFSAVAESITLAPGDSALVEFVFQPLQEGVFEDTLLVTTNDGDAVVLLAGTGSPLKPGDFDRSGKVDFDDLFLFADAFGKPAEGDLVRFDLDSSGHIDIPDFFEFAENFGN